MWAIILNIVELYPHCIYTIMEMTISTKTEVSVECLVNFASPKMSISSTFHSMSIMYTRFHLSVKRMTTRYVHYIINQLLNTLCQQINTFFKFVCLKIFCTWCIYTKRRLTTHNCNSHCIYLSSIPLTRSKEQVRILV